MILLYMKTVTSNSGVVTSSSSSSSILSSSSSSWLPSTNVCRQLFITGTTIGPIIDGLHNQCLLQYQFAPITIDLPKWLSTLSNSDVVSTTTTTSYYEPHLFASSWCIPPLLGITYLVLGGILPRIIQNILTILTDIILAKGNSSTTTTSDVVTNSRRRSPPKEKSPSTFILGCKALLAVISTAMIIRFSQYLLLHPNESQYIGIIDNTAVFESSDKLEQHLLILMTAAITQWAYLDGTFIAFITATITSFVGPLCELPFISHHIWTYLIDAGDMYIPLQYIDPISIPGQFLRTTLGNDYNTLTLNGVTGPCYFAVTMDAIALGRYFTSLDDASTTTKTIGGISRNRDENSYEIIPPENRLFIAASSRNLYGNDNVSSSRSPSSSESNATTLDHQGDTTS